MIAKHVRNDHAQSVQSILRRLFLRTNASKNNDNLFNSFVIRSHDKLWSLDEQLNKILITELCLFKIVLKREELEPRGDDHVGIDDVLLMLQNFSKSCNSIVSSMVKLSLLALLFFGCSVHWVTDGFLEAIKAELAYWCIMSSTVLCNHTNSVN